MDSVNQQIPSQPINSNKWLKTLGIGFGIVSFGIAIGVIGYILGTKNSQTVVQNQQSSRTSNAIPSPTSIATVTPVSDVPVITDVDKTTKKVTFPAYGISFAIPNDFYIDTNLVTNTGNKNNSITLNSNAWDLLEKGQMNKDIKNNAVSFHISINIVDSVASRNISVGRRTDYNGIAYDSVKDNSIIPPNNSLFTNNGNEFYARVKLEGQIPYSYVGAIYMNLLYSDGKYRLTRADIGCTTTDVNIKTTAYLAGSARCRDILKNALSTLYIPQPLKMVPSEMGSEYGGDYN